MGVMDRGFVDSDVGASIKSHITRIWRAVSSDESLPMLPPRWERVGDGQGVCRREEFVIV